jgi:hypothetical protein
MNANPKNTKMRMEEKMRKILLGSLMVVLVAVFCLAAAANAYTFNDPVGDKIGVWEFETYGINVLNYTPGVYSGAISFELFTNYPQAGLTVGAWNTQVADLFIAETYYGANYQWAIPLVSHDGFNAGTMYAVGSYLLSDSQAPAGGGYIFNHNVPVRIDTIGTNYGYQSFGGGSVVWNPLGGPGSSDGGPDYMISVVTGGLYQDDPNGVYEITWGTATCANDVVTGSTNPVPEPATMLLLGLGLVGMGVGARRKFVK